MQWVQCFVHCLELRNRNWRWIEAARCFFQEKLEWYQHAQKNSVSYSGWAFSGLLTEQGGGGGWGGERGGEKVQTSNDETWQSYTLPKEDSKKL